MLWLLPNTGGSQPPGEKLSLSPPEDTGDECQPLDVFKLTLVKRFSLPTDQSYFKTSKVGGGGEKTTANSPLVLIVA